MTVPSKLLSIPSLVRFWLQIFSLLLSIINLYSSFSFVNNDENRFIEMLAHCSNSSKIESLDRRVSNEYRICCSKLLFNECIEKNCGIESNCSEWLVPIGEQVCLPVLKNTQKYCLFNSLNFEGYRMRLYSICQIQIEQKLEQSGQFDLLPNGEIDNVTKRLCCLQHHSCDCYHQRFRMACHKRSLKRAENKDSLCDCSNIGIRSQRKCRKIIERFCERLSSISEKFIENQNVLSFLFYILTITAINYGLFYLICAKYRMWIKN
ncbi:Myosin regulatory light chain 2 protein [Sarcoptes scabiei]|nr:Myosin regulatory light chain 2 protein [Sarcoptes scabiei]